MRVVVHDYSGHPGQAQLSRELARLGHDVTHQHCSSYVTGKGSLESRFDDPPSLTIEDVQMRGTFRRYAPIVRLAQEILYGIRVATAINNRQPDVAVLCNIPLLGHFVAFLLLRARHVPMVFWQQDIYSVAIKATAERRLGPAGRYVGQVANVMERAIARGSNAVICIAPAFVGELLRWGVSDEKITVVPNWGPVNEVTPRPKRNTWSERHELAERPVILYAGTLGLKHDPAVLLELGQWMRDHDPDARMVVVSEGRGRDWLETRAGPPGALPQLQLLNFQPYEEFPDVLGAADVVLSVLDPEASKFSVPSKVLTYLCAGRPIVATVPDDNYIAQMVRAGGGVVVPPGEHQQTVLEVERFLTDGSIRRASAITARAYAEQTFDIGKISRQFERILVQVAT
jgi:glycosyltransferase involved in cell wall biosynthesis